MPTISISARIIRLSKSIPAVGGEYLLLFDDDRHEIISKEEAARFQEATRPMAKRAIKTVKEAPPPPPPLITPQTIQAQKLSVLRYMQEHQGPMTNEDARVLTGCEKSSVLSQLKALGFVTTERTDKGPLLYRLTSEGRAIAMGGAPGGNSHAS